MNHGHFFQLNHSSSRLDDGVVIFDYTELPAYEGRESDNDMSPKYPVSLVIMSDSVRFRMHYCAYKNDGQDVVYDYVVGSRLKKNVQLVHVEDVILELPFVENPTSDLTDIVKGTYIANFPQVLPKAETEVMGSRFLDKLIRDIFPEPASPQANDRNNGAISYSTLWLMDLYKDGSFNLYDDKAKANDKDTDGKKPVMVTKFLRKLLLDFMFDLKHSSVFCTSPNYDRMYNGLMSNYYFSALMHKCEFYYYRELTIRAIEEGNSQSQQQVTRLYAVELFKAEEAWAADIRNPLSDKFFEQNFPDDFKQNRWLRGQQWTEFLSNVFERMTTTRWDSWFANPEEEMRRIYFSMKENRVERICNSVVLSEYLAMDKSKEDAVKAMALSARQNRGNTSRWFLNRYDFNDVLHLHLFWRSNLLLVLLIILALLILFEVIPIGLGDTNKGIRGMLHFANCAREFIVDKYSGIILLEGGLLLVGVLLFIKWGPFLSFDESPLITSERRFRVKRTLLIIWAMACLMLLPYNLLHAVNYSNWLYAFIAIVFACTFTFLFVKNTMARICFVLLAIALCWCFNLIHCGDWKAGVKILAILLVAAGGFLLVDSYFDLGVFRKPYIHPIESWHLLLPKLVASITAAWLTIAMGFDALAAFFDSVVLWSTMTIIIIVVFSFILYQIDRELPESSSWLKVYRTVEMLIISYCLSLCIGVIIINFVGESYLERSGTISDYYEENVYENGQVPLIVKLDNKDTLIAVSREAISGLSTQMLSVLKQRKPEIYSKLVIKDSVTSAISKDTLANLATLESMRDRLYLFSHNYTKLHWTEDTVYECDSKDPVLDRKKIDYSKQGLFIIPDFTIMFSFVAMFIGVFLQMVFFDRKKMTEF